MTDVLDWLQTYKFNDKVEGWLDSRAMNYLKLIYKVTGIPDIHGGVLEIGVHHGKFFIPLNALASPGSISVALDLFEDQYLNIDAAAEAILRLSSRTSNCTA